MGRGRECYGRLKRAIPFPSLLSRSSVGAAYRRATRSSDRRSETEAETVAREEEEEDEEDRHEAQARAEAEAEAEAAEEAGAPAERAAKRARGEEAGRARAPREELAGWRQQAAYYRRGQRTALQGAIEARRWAKGLQPYLGLQRCRTHVDPFWAVGMVGGGRGVLPFVLRSTHDAFRISYLVPRFSAQGR